MLPTNSQEIRTIADWIKRVQELETTFQHPQYWPWPFPDCDGPPNDLDLGDLDEETK